MEKEKDDLDKSNIANNAIEMHELAKRLEKSEKKNRQLKKENREISKTAHKIIHEQDEQLRKYHIRHDHET